MTISDERIAVLADQLLARMQEHLGDPGLAFAGPPTRLTGGFWAELVSFRVAPAGDGWDGPLVARVMPDPDTAAKESAFQLEVADQGYSTPVVRLTRGPDAGIDGRAVMVMDLAAGAPLLGGLDGVQALTRLPSLARRLPVVLAGALADLHRLDPSPVVTRIAGSGAPRPDVDGMLRHLRGIGEVLDRRALLAALTWLADHRPPTDSDVICHGDLHPFNVLVDEQQQVTVLDWSAAVIAPRAYDLGFTSLMLAEPPLMVAPPLRPVIRLGGRVLSKRFLRSYEQQAGVRIDRAALAWFHGLICVRALADVASWAAAGTLDDRRGHPWVINQRALVDRLHGLTGTSVPIEGAGTDVP